MWNIDSKSFFKSIARSIPRKSLVAFFVSLLIAIVIWLFQSFDQRYQYQLAIRLDHSEIAEGTVFRYPFPNYLSIRIEATGWDIIKSKHLQRKVVIFLDLEKYPEKNVIESLQLIKQNIPEELSAINILNVVPDNLNIQLDQVVQKEVAVEPMVEIKFNQQFGLSGAIRTEPEVVTITGPATEIKSITKVQTLMSHFSNLDAKVIQSIDLKGQANKSITYNVQKVNLIIPVEQLSEGKMMLPVRLPGQMSDSISLIPDHVTVIYQAAISLFSSITDKDLSPYVKQSDLEKADGGKVKIYVQRNNPLIYSLRATPDYVDFIITK